MARTGVAVCKVEVQIKMQVHQLRGNFFGPHRQIDVDEAAQILPGYLAVFLDSLSMRRRLSVYLADNETQATVVL